MFSHASFGQRALFSGLPLVLTLLQFIGKEQLFGEVLLHLLGLRGIFTLRCSSWIIRALVYERHEKCLIIMMLCHLIDIHGIFKCSIFMVFILSFLGQAN